MEDVLALSFVRFVAFRDNAPGPAQRKIATEAAGHCLWALGVEEHSGIVAVEPEPLGKTIDGIASPLLDSSEVSPRAVLAVTATPT
jgi:hypothetical protein